MNIHIAKNPKELGAIAAAKIAALLRETIKEKGSARFLLNTGASHFETISHLIKEKVDWSKVEMFQIDEFVGVSDKHKASFCGYLKKRFTSKVNLKAAHFISGEGDVNATIAKVTKEMAKAPIDVGAVGIGENGHIGFNDPPADFKTKKTYIITKLDQKNKAQLIREGWFKNAAEVPVYGLTITPYAVMKCRHIVSSMPFKTKADTVFDVLTKKVSPKIPGTILKTHPDWSLYIDADSAAKVFPL